MKKITAILFLFLVFSSCREDKTAKLNGVWRTDFNEEIKNQFFPMYLSFMGDTLGMVDGYEFKHTTNFTLKKDTIYLTFQNGDELKMNYQFNSDRTIELGGVKYYRVPSDYYSIVPDYDLVGFKTNATLRMDLESSIIHLVKVNGKAKVLLNDIICDLREIPKFLHGGHGPVSYPIIYLGKGIKFKDLLEAYKWVQTLGIMQVTLVTGNKTFEEFYIQKDLIKIDESLMEELSVPKRKYPLFPPITFEVEVIEFRGLDDFQKLKEINDSTNYLIQVDDQINLMEYLELNQRLVGKKNVLKKVKSYLACY